MLKPLTNSLSLANQTRDSRGTSRCTMMVTARFPLKYPQAQPRIGSTEDYRGVDITTYLGINVFNPKLTAPPPPYDPRGPFNPPFIIRISLDAICDQSYCLMWTSAEPGGNHVYGATTFKTNACIDNSNAKPFAIQTTIWFMRSILATIHHMNRNTALSVASQRRMSAVSAAC